MSMTSTYNGIRSNDEYFEEIKKKIDGKTIVRNKYIDDKDNTIIKNNDKTKVKLLVIDATIDNINATNTPKSAMISQQINDNIGDDNCDNYAITESKSVIGRTLHVSHGGIVFYKKEKGEVKILINHVDTKYYDIGGKLTDNTKTVEENISNIISTKTNNVINYESLLSRLYKGHFVYYINEKYILFLIEASTNEKKLKSFDFERMANKQSISISTITLNNKNIVKEKNVCNDDEDDNDIFDSKNSNSNEKIGWIKRTLLSNKDLCKYKVSKRLKNKYFLKHLDELTLQITTSKSMFI